MKASELSINDWAHFHYKNGFKEEVSFDFKVTQLPHRYGNENQVWGKSVDGKHHGNIGDVSKIEPVPITTEILEKNFGEKIDGEYFYGDEFCELYINEISDSIWRVEYDCVEMNGIPRQSNNVFFVHELQHALRLCGFNDKADDFFV